MVTSLHPERSNGRFERKVRIQVGIIAPRQGDYTNQYALDEHCFTSRKRPYHYVSLFYYTLELVVSGTLHTAKGCFPIATTY